MHKIILSLVLHAYSFENQLGDFWYPTKWNWSVYTHEAKKKEVVKSKPLIQLQTSFVKSASWRVLYAWPTLFSWLQYILFLLRYIGYIRVLLIYRHNNFRVGFFIYLGIRLESEICLHNIFKLFSRNFVGKYLLQWQVLLFLG